MTRNIIVGIDASRNRSGGAIAHLIGILSHGNPLSYGISELHLWSYQSLLDKIPSSSWLKKHNPKELESSLAQQLWWQAINFKKELISNRCDILFTSDASSLCRFRPNVVMSQDLLSYENGIMKRYGFSRDRLRLLTILQIQNRAFRNANGVIFLTEYAAQLIQRSCGQLSRTVVISHGVDNAFKEVEKVAPWPIGGERPIRCVYVSNIAPYKYQWVVLRAVAEIRRRGFDAEILFVGSGSGKPLGLLTDAARKYDPTNAFVRISNSVRHDQIPSILSGSDIFIFASACETFGISLLEAMAVGLPIACSNRSCIPELVEDAGSFFDPEDHRSIADSLERIITDRTLRLRISNLAKSISNRYSWSRCADETWSFITETYKALQI